MWKCSDFAIATIQEEFDKKYWMRIVKWKKIRQINWNLYGNLICFLTGN